MSACFQLKLLQPNSLSDLYSISTTKSGSSNIYFTSGSSQKLASHTFLFAMHIYEELRPLGFEAYGPNGLISTDKVFGQSADLERHNKMAVFGRPAELDRHYKMGTHV